ncbi:hypothetical protein HMPREF0444_1433, partial [Granulicatella adiacens ATCC 49175]
KLCKLGLVPSLFCRDFYVKAILFYRNFKRKFAIMKRMIKEEVE